MACTRKPEFPRDAFHVLTLVAGTDLPVVEVLGFGRVLAGDCIGAAASNGAVHWRFADLGSGG